MKKLMFVLIIFFAFSLVNAQTKKVLLEEFTGTACGNCPMGGYYLDSMLAKYPGLTGVSLHSFPPYDAMNFSEIDTLFTAYAGGVPCGAIDRVFWGGVKPVVTVYIEKWDSIIQKRLAETPLLTVRLSHTWNPLTRMITADVSVGILANMPSGDYRIGVYVTEDSITGTGTGYDQLNYYNTIKGNPFFGRGNPIIGYVHRHVARALLPSPWGLTGLIPSMPQASQIYNYQFNYALPSHIREKRVQLLAFVYRYSTGHKGDEVLNVDEKKLLNISGLNEEAAMHPALVIYPNPARGRIIVRQKDKQPYQQLKLRINSLDGRVVFAEEIPAGQQEINIDLEHIPAGIYIICEEAGDRMIYRQKLMVY